MKKPLDLIGGLSFVVDTFLGAITFCLIVRFLLVEAFPKPDFDYRAEYHPEAIIVCVVLIAYFNLSFKIERIRKDLKSELADEEG